MKKMRSLLSVAITAIMMLCLCSFNVSAETYTIKVTDPTGTSGGLIDGRTFTAYKVFALSYSGTNYTYTLDSGCLSGGSEYESPYTLADVTAWAADDETKAREFATYLYNKYIVTNSIPAGVTKADVVASGGEAVITVTNPGYYMVVENGDTSGLTSLVMLGNTDPTAEIVAKIGSTGKPTLDKSIINNNDRYTGSWGKVLDNQIGDIVCYKIETTFPDPKYFNNFTDYKYIVHDELDSGLTYADNTVNVQINNGDLGGEGLWYTITKSGQQMTIDFDVKKIYAERPVKPVVGDTIEIYYTAKLNTSAKVAASETDDDKHNTNEAYLEYSIDPYDTSKKTETPHIKTYDWTYQFSVEKVDEGGNYLAGAEFEIKNGSDTLKFSNNSSNEYTVDPAGSITKITTDSTGKFVIRGIDQGVTYTIKETKAPDGYGLPDDDATIILNATYNIDGSEIDTLTGTINHAKNPSGFNVIIENTSGAKLVGTGGMGTTVFYVFGGILMAGAAVLLTVKIRIKNK